MKRVVVLLLFLFLFGFGCLGQSERESLGLSTKEISIEEGTSKLSNAEVVGIIMVKDDITQENWVKVIECAIGYSGSLGEKNKTIINYGVENQVCLTDDLGESTLEECGKHIKEKTDYNIYIMGGKEAEFIFYEDNMRIVVPENNVIECKIN